MQGGAADLGGTERGATVDQYEHTTETQLHKRENGLQGRVDTCSHGMGRVSIPPISHPYSTIWTLYSKLISPSRNPHSHSLYSSYSSRKVRRAPSYPLNTSLDPPEHGDTFRLFTSLRLLPALVAELTLFRTGYEPLQPSC